MSMRLDQLVSSAREHGARAHDDVWDIERSERVRAGTLRRRDTRVRRDRALRRALVVASGAGLLVLGLLRAASSAPNERDALTTTSVLAPAPTSEAIAARALSDAGYARD
jgi:hypothetical protein